MIAISLFSKSSVFKVFSVHNRNRTRNKASFSNSSGLKSVFEKLRFRDGLVGTVDLTVEINLRFQISPVQCGQGLLFSSSICGIAQSEQHNVQK